MLSLLITSAAGSILFLAWMAIVYGGREKQNVRYNYWLLRGVLAGYLLTFIYLAACQCIGYTRNQHDILFVTTASLDKMFFAFFLVWLVGLLLRIVSQIHRRNCFKGMEKSRIIVPKEYTALLQRLCEEMEIRRHVSLYLGYGVQTPFICGVRYPTIFLPVKELSEGELEIILYHELVHYKQGDTFWKPLFGAIENVYWFNPLSGLLWREAARWAEANCDSYCCGERFDTKKYFTLLLAMGTEQIQTSRYIPMWSEGGAELIWRINCIKKNFRKRTSVILTVVLAATSMLGGNVSAHVAAQGMKMLYQQAYSNTVDGTEVCLRPEDMLWHCAIYNPVVDELFIKKRKEISQKGREAFSTAGVMNWDVSARTAYYSDGFYAESGDDIKIRVAIQPSREDVQVGIVKPDGKVFYVTGSNFISQIFSASETGIYKVFVKNTGRKTVVVDGSYMIRHDFSL